MYLEQIGWKPFFAKPSQGGTLGRVAQASRERFLVWTESGELEATIGGHFRHVNDMWPCVGDWVVLRDSAVIVGVLARATKISRKAPGRNVAEQVLAANVDALFIVSGLDRDYNPRRLERYLILAHESGARPIIVLNKADLRDDLASVIAGTESMAPGILVIAVSALYGWGLEHLTSRLEMGETAALIGSSGAGKSTIVNCLLGAHRQTTARVRDSDSRGRHTTTQRELILMPHGWLLIDMPGLRELQLWADPEQIDNTFADIAELAAACRFRDCTHSNEPGCAVLAAGIDPARLHSFYKLTRELAFLDRQQDTQLARETKRRWKTIHKAMRHNPKRS